MFFCDDVKLSKIFNNKTVLIVFFVEPLKHCNKVIFHYVLSNLKFNLVKFYLYLSQHHTLYILFPSSIYVTAQSLYNAYKISLYFTEVIPFVLQVCITSFFKIINCQCYNSEYYNIIAKVRRKAMFACGLTLYDIKTRFTEHPFCLVCKNMTLLVFESFGYLWPNRNCSSRCARGINCSVPFLFPLADHVIKCKLVMRSRSRIYIYLSCFSRIEMLKTFLLV